MTWRDAAIAIAGGLVIVLVLLVMKFSFTQILIGLFG